MKLLDSKLDKKLRQNVVLTQLKFSVQVFSNIPVFSTHRLIKTKSFATSRIWQRIGWNQLAVIPNPRK